MTKLTEYTSAQYVFQLIYGKNPLQKKKIESLVEKRGNSHLRELDDFVQEYSAFLMTHSLSIENAVDAYLRMCGEMLTSQIKFMRTGSYPVSDSESFRGDLYNNRERMTSYMIGLALSQYLWDSHYEMYSCLREYFEKNGDAISSYLEIGPGHGLFLKTALKHAPVNAKISAVDISPVSLDITRSIIERFFPGRRVTYRNIDVLKLEHEERYDFITMGEVLEHVNHPDTLLAKLAHLLKPRGRAFISTCVNCPAIDHVVHFRTVDEIRDILAAAGLSISQERIAPSENLPMCEVAEKKITVNYCAIVKKAGHEQI